MASISKSRGKLDVELNEAKRLHLAGNLTQAQKKYEKLIKKSPSNAKLLNLLGGLLLQKEVYAKAEPLLKRSVALNGKDADAFYNLALSQYHQKKFAEAIESYQQAVAINPNHDRAYYMMAKAYLEWDRNKYRNEAVDAYLKDISITDRVDSHTLVSEILHEAGKNDEARSVARRVLELDPNNEIGIFVLTKTLIAENYDKSLVDIRHAEPIIKAGNLLLKLYPGSWRGHHLIAEGLAMIGENELAIDHYRIVNKMLPEFAVSRTNLGVLLLKRGELKQGWEEIAHRRVHGEELYGMQSEALQNCPAELWKGEIVEGKRLFIATEQGIGDQFLQCQTLKQLIDRGMIVHMTCTDKIVPIMQRSIPEVTFYAHNEKIPQETLNMMDYKSDLLDLGKYLRNDFSQFEQKFYYLKPLPELASYYREKYRKFGKKLKVGISWRSSSRSVGSIKSTQLTQWENILKIPEVQFINIQYGDVSSELLEVKQTFGVDVYQDDFDPYQDIEKAVAQISALDLVISVSNAAVHMAGQLNIPTWVLLNSRALWHWFENRQDSVWYDSLKLYRQRQLESWEPVLTEVANDLEKQVRNQ